MVYNEVSIRRNFRMFTLKELLTIEHIGVRNIEKATKLRVKGVAIDSRKIQKGDVFIALRGEIFDGHDFVASAFEKGAVCAIVDNKWKETNKSLPIIVVPDTTRALGELGKYHRRKFQIPVIAVTGSSGKTTTKEMISSVLGTTYNVLYTEGNLNNHIGVPLTLFRLKKNNQVAVIEMGMNHANEISYLCKIVEPTYGIITNVGKAHLEFFKSVKSIAEAKGELFSWLGSTKKNIGFVNMDDELVVSQAKKLRSKVTFSERSKHANVFGNLNQVDKKGCPQFSISNSNWKKPIEVTLKSPGVHNILNALGAVAVGTTFGVTPADIKAGLEKFKSVKGRMEVVTSNGVTILNDTYNANPESMVSALKTVSSMECKGKRIVVLGDMFELGKSALSEHKKIGSILRSFKCDVLVTVGNLAQNIHDKAKVKTKVHYAGREALTKYLKEIVQKGDLVLVKGSHGMKMNEIVQSLLQGLEVKR